MVFGLAPAIVERDVAPLPTYVSQYPASRVSSACSCLTIPLAVQSVTSTAPAQVLSVISCAAEEMEYTNFLPRSPPSPQFCLQIYVEGAKPPTTHTAMALEIAWTFSPLAPHLIAAINARGKPIAWPVHTYLVTANT